MPDPIYPPLPPMPGAAAVQPDKFAPGAPGPGAGALDMGRAGTFPPLPTGPAPSNGANSSFQQSWQAAPGGGTTPQSGGAGAVNATTAAMTDPAADYAALFGTTTPQTRVAQGLPVAGPVNAQPAVMPQAPAKHESVPPNGGGADNAPAAPKSTPQQAGDNNSLMPGWSNGQPIVGAPSEAGSAGVDTRTLAATAGPSPVNYPPLPTAAPPAPPATEFPPLPQGAAAGTAEGEGRESAAAPPPQGAAAGQTATSTGEPMAQPLAAGQQKTAQAAAPTTINYGGASYTLTNPAHRLPQNWAAMSDPQKQRWLKANSTIGADPRSQGLDALNGTQYTHLQLPANNPVKAGGGNISAGMSAADINTLTGGDPALNRLALDAKAIYDSISGPSGADVGKLTAAKLAQFNAATKALAAYGITVGPQATTTPTPTPDDQGGGQQGGGGGQSGGGGGGSIPGGGQGGQPAPGFENTNLDLATGTGGRTYTDYLTLYTKAYGPERAPGMAEAAMAADQQANLDKNRQSSVNLIGGALKDYEDSGIYKGVQTLGQSILDNPDPTNWDAIRSRKIADAQEQGQAALRTLGASAARRLGSGGLGAVAAQAADVQREADRGLSNDLGDLEIQKSVGKRDNEIKSIQAALGALSGTQGVQIQNLYQLANLITGNAAQYGNPYEGSANYFAAIKQAEDMKRAGDPRTLDDILAGIGALSGAAKGAGAAAAGFKG